MLISDFYSWSFPHLLCSKLCLGTFGRSNAYPQISINKTFPFFFFCYLFLFFRALFAQGPTTILYNARSQCQDSFSRYLYISQAQETAFYQPETFILSTGKTYKYKRLTELWEKFSTWQKMYLKGWYAFPTKQAVTILRCNLTMRVAIERGVLVLISGEYIKSE